MMDFVDEYVVLVQSKILMRVSDLAWWTLCCKEPVSPYRDCGVALGLSETELQRLHCSGSLGQHRAGGAGSGKTHTSLGQEVRRLQSCVIFEIFCDSKIHSRYVPSN